MNRLEFEVALISRAADEIGSSCSLLEGISRKNDLMTPAFELRRAATNLREAAAKLDTICERSKAYAVQEG